MQEKLEGELDPGQFDSLLDLLRYIKQKHGDRPGFKCFSRQMTYGEIDDLSDRFAAYIQQKTGLKPGDRIAIQLPNLLQFPVVLYGALKAGLIVVNTNPLYTAREMQHQFEDSGVRAIVILDNFCDKLQSIVEKTTIEYAFVTSIGDLQPPLVRLAMNFAVRYIKKMVPAYQLPDAIPLRKTLDTISTQPDSHISGKGNDTALILYTGGTTGYAKGVRLSHRNLIANLMQLRSRSRGIIADKNEIIMAPLPLYHSYAFLFHCLYMPQAGNLNILVPNPRDLSSVIKTLNENRVTGFVGINTLYLALLQNDAIRKVDFDALHFCGAGGMPLTLSVAEEWEKLVGCKVYEGYGLTECSPVVSVNSESKFRVGTVGMPLVDTEIQVVDDEGKVLPAGEKGELWIRGPQVMQGYWNRDSDTAEVLTEDGWFKSGDYVQVDQDGYIKIVDRKKDIILVSGFNVVPGEIEEFVNSHPDVLESAAIGVPDSQSGETVVLYVITRTGKSLTAKDVREFCRQGLTAYKLPSEVKFVRELPKSNVGKILRRELRELHGQET